MNKNKSIEMRIYELLGVNLFRKYILFSWEKIAKILHIPIKYRLSNLSTNAVTDYKIATFCFSVIHGALLFIYIIDCISIKGSISNYLFAYFLNSYCIMTQRYNYLRIKRIENKRKILDERKNNIIKNSIKDDLLPLEYTDKMERETSITFDDLITDSNIEQLKQMREDLLELKNISQSVKENDFYFVEHQEDASIPMNKSKTIKLELKLNKTNNNVNN